MNARCPARQTAFVCADSSNISCLRLTSRRSMAAACFPFGGARNAPGTRRPLLERDWSRRAGVNSLPQLSLLPARMPYLAASPRWIAPLDSAVFSSLNGSVGPREGRAVPGQRTLTFRRRSSATTEEEGTEGELGALASWGFLLPVPCLLVTLDTGSVSHVRVGWGGQVC